MPPDRAAPVRAGRLSSGSRGAVPDGWIVFAAGTLGVAASVAGQPIGLSAFTDPLLGATGLDRVALSSAYLVGTVSAGLLAPLTGALIDRLGARRAAVAGSALLGAALLYLSAIDGAVRRLAGAQALLDRRAVAWVGLSLGFAAMCIGAQGLLAMASRAMLARRFDRRRGLVMASSGALTSLLFAATPTLLLLWIGADGWQRVWAVLAAAIALGMGSVAALFYRDGPRPEDAAVSEGAARRGAVRQWSRADALRTGSFWILTAATVIQSLIGTGITFHIVDVGAEAGLAASAVLGLFVPISAVGICFGLAAGQLIDRAAPARSIAAMLLAQVVMFLCAAHLAHEWARVGMVLGWGASAAFAVTLPAAALPKLFGSSHVGAIYGVHGMCVTLAVAAGPTLLATLHQQLGSYRAALEVACALPVLVLVALVRSRGRGP